MSYIIQNLIHHAVRAIAESIHRGSLKKDIGEIFGVEEKANSSTVTTSIISPESKDTTHPK